MKQFFTALFLITLLLFSTTNFGQAPPLGNAAGYAVFTSAGAVNNTGVSIITGNIGTNAGAFNGFTQGLVSGQINVVNAASLLTAIDVNAAYAFMSIPTQDSTLGVTLGNGQVLKPGNYRIGAAATMSGVLTLDGMNNPGALFIIKINGAFASDASAVIQLTNGASLSNIYWQVNGQLTIGTNTTFMGTALVNGVIIVENGAEVTGRLLSQDGAINMANNRVSIPAQSILPVTLKQFTADNQSGGTLIRWSASNESGIRAYNIEYRMDLTTGSWLTAGTVVAVNAGNLTQLYSFMHHNLDKQNCYYRLRIISNDGSLKYSGILLVKKTADPASTELYPNPVKDFLVITSANNIAKIEIVEMSGKIIRTENIAGNSTTRLNTALLIPGMYILKTIYKNHTTSQTRFIKID